MDTSTLPKATAGSLETLIGLLADRGVTLRVEGGRLRMRDPDHRLHDVDRGVLRHYRDDLLIYLTSGACPHCGAVLHDDRVAYRTDDINGDLLERCVGCGCTWLWGDTSAVQLPGRPHDIEITAPTEDSI
jgi:hypothetical protein